MRTFCPQHPTVLTRGQRGTAVAHLRDHLTEAGHDVGTLGLLVVSKDARQQDDQDKHGAQVHLGREERDRSEKLTSGWPGAQAWRLPWEGQRDEMAVVSGCHLQGMKSACFKYIVQ